MELDVELSMAEEGEEVEEEEEEGEETGQPSNSSACCAVCELPTPKARVHYGGVSCYSCRAFFRRAVQKGCERKCKKDRKCTISYRDRKQCAGCRWVKCLSIGMRPNLVLNQDEKKLRFRKLLEKKSVGATSTETSSTNHRLADPETLTPAETAALSIFTSENACMAPDSTYDSFGEADDDVMEPNPGKLRKVERHSHAQQRKRGRPRATEVEPANQPLPPPPCGQPQLQHHCAPPHNSHRSVMDHRPHLPPVRRSSDVNPLRAGRETRMLADSLHPLGGFPPENPLRASREARMLADSLHPLGGFPPENPLRHIGAITDVATVAPEITFGQKSPRLPGGLRKDDSQDILDISHHVPPSVWPRPETSGTWAKPTTNSASSPWDYPPANPELHSPTLIPEPSQVQQPCMSVGGPAPSPHYEPMPSMLSPEQAVQLSLLEQKYAEERRQILLSAVKKERSYSAGKGLRRPSLGEHCPALSAGVGVSKVEPDFSSDLGGDWEPQQQYLRSPTLHLQRRPVIVMEQQPPLPAHQRHERATMVGNLWPDPELPAYHPPAFSVVRRVASQPSLEGSSECLANLPPSEKLSSARRLLLPSQCERKRLHPSQVERSRLLREQARLRAAAATSMPVPVSDATSSHAPGVLRWGASLLPRASQSASHQESVLQSNPAYHSNVTAVTSMARESLLESSGDFVVGRGSGEVESRLGNCVTTPPRQQQVNHWQEAVATSTTRQAQGFNVHANALDKPPAAWLPAMSPSANRGRPCGKTGDIYMDRSQSQAELSGLLNCFYQEPRQFPGLRAHINNEEGSTELPRDEAVCSRRNETKANKPRCKEDMLDLALEETVFADLGSGGPADDFDDILNENFETVREALPVVPEDLVVSTRSSGSQEVRGLGCPPLSSGPVSVSASVSASTPMLDPISRTTLIFATKSAVTAGGFTPTIMCSSRSSTGPLVTTQISVAAAARKMKGGRRNSRKQQQAERDDHIDLQHILRHWNYRHKKFCRITDPWETGGEDMSQPHREQYELGDFEYDNIPLSPLPVAAMTSGLLASPPTGGMSAADGSGLSPTYNSGSSGVAAATSTPERNTGELLPFEYRDEDSLLNYILHIDVKNLEEIYTTEEQSYIEHQNAQFWRKWAEYSLGPQVMSLQIEWVIKGGELHPSFFTIGNRQLRERIIGFVFEYDDLDRLPSKDFITLLRHNVKLGGMLYNIFSYSLGSGDKQQFYTLGQRDKEQWEASKLSPVGLTEIFKAIPISKTAKRKVNKILNYFKHHFLADPKVYVIVLGIVLYNPAGLNLEAKEKAEAIQQEYITMLRRYLSTRGEDFSRFALRIIFECIDILPTMFKLFSMCNNDPPPLESSSSSSTQFDPESAFQPTPMLSLTTTLEPAFPAGFDATSESTFQPDLFSAFSSAEEDLNFKQEAQLALTYIS